MSRLLRLAALCGFLAPLLQAAPPGVDMGADPTRPAFSSELPPAETPAEKFLTVALLDEATERTGAPLFGDYVREKDRLVFRPRFALAPGARYRIVAGHEHRDHIVPPPVTQDPATVERILPEGEEVPANILKFYLHFSRPMREGREVFTHIHLLDSAGEPIPAPWRDTELWTEDARRLTLWLHPGRVKRGVNLREQLGPLLEPGHRYTLLIDAGLRDASGQPLGREFRREFLTTGEIHARLDLAGCALEIPPGGSREPLRIRFPVALDTTIAQRCLHVRTADRQALPGQGSMLRDARTFLFYPAKSWAATPHRIDADRQIEDLAGNNFTRVFDDDISLPVAAPPPINSLSFTPR